MDKFPLQKAKAVACYTLDGGKAPEVEAECFTAYAVKAEFFGKVIHIGAARGKLANAVAMAASFIGMLPRSESPEATDAWYGYYCPIEVSGTLDHAGRKCICAIFIRTHAGEIGRSSICGAVESQFPAVTSSSKSLGNTSTEAKARRPPRCARETHRAIPTAATSPSEAIRGGNDGVATHGKGIPTPNLFTGGYNYHSR
jgi:tripeptide aminopeptidase